MAPTQSKLFVWEEPRLGSKGYVTAYVISQRVKGQRACRRQNKEEAQQLLARLASCADLSLDGLKRLSKSNPKDMLKFVKWLK